MIQDPNKHTEDFRIEHDSLGEVRVPRDVLYGAQTQRALQNFPISPLQFPRCFVMALGWIKAAAANANGQLNELPAETANAIERAAWEVAGGDYDSQFVVDVFQSGSGTSTNMNANEVIAHLAAQSLGRAVHPNDEVNRNQSSNDVIPTAIHVSALHQLQNVLVPALQTLRDGLNSKAVKFHDVVKMGRTHLQDAVPMRLGQEFSGYGAQVDSAIRRLQAAGEEMRELALGGTAVGTGINAPKEFARLAVAEIAKISSIPFREAANHFEAQASMDRAGMLSGALRNCAITLMKIANDIRLMASGPRSGLGELILPAVQPGSSIMPGKVNPVIAESLLMACAQVIGHDAAISWCCASGVLELNLMLPLLAYNLLDSISLLTAASINFHDRCLQGIEVDRERITGYAERSLANATALVPVLGYDLAAKIAQEAHRTGRNVREVAAELTDLTENQLNHLLNPARLVGD